GEVVRFERERRLQAKQEQAWDLPAVIKIEKEIPLAAPVCRRAGDESVTLEHVVRERIQAKLDDVDTFILCIVIIDTNKGNEREICRNILVRRFIERRDDAIVV